MLIILEGSDGSGKSTLAAQLADTLRVAYPDDRVDVLHRGPLRDDPVIEYERDLLDYVPGTGRHVICDRWHLGEYVYPPVVHGRASRLDPARWLHIELLLQARGAYLLYCAVPPDVARANVESRGDDLVEPTHLAAIRSRYHDALGRTRLPFRSHDYTTASAFFVEQVLFRARELEAAAAPLGDFVTYVGPPRPRTLLLGAVRHGLRHVPPATLRASPETHRTTGPAFGPLSSTSGHFLLSHVEPEVRHDPTALGLANACDADDPERLWCALGRPDVTALGREACRALCDLSIPHGAVPHPQYVRRFLHAYGSRYALLIAETLGECTHRLDWRPDKSWIGRARAAARASKEVE